MMAHLYHTSPPFSVTCVTFFMAEDQVYGFMSILQGGKAPNSPRMQQRQRILPPEEGEEGA